MKSKIYLRVFFFFIMCFFSNSLLGSGKVFFVPYYMQGSQARFLVKHSERFYGGTKAKSGVMKTASDYWNTQTKRTWDITSWWYKKNSYFTEIKIGNDVFYFVKMRGKPATQPKQSKWVGSAVLYRMHRELENNTRFNSVLTAWNLGYDKGVGSPPQPGPSGSGQDVQFYSTGSDSYRFTNFWEGPPIFFEGQYWATSENFFQACKFKIHSYQFNMVAKAQKGQVGNKYAGSPGKAAFLYARQFASQGRSDWHSTNYDPLKQSAGSGFYYPPKPPLLPDSYKKLCINGPDFINTGTRGNRYKMWDLVQREWTTTKIAVMYVIVKAKFSQNADLKNYLLNTGNKRIVEHTGNDDYWADNQGQATFMSNNPPKGYIPGLNMLGFVLMRVRDELKGNGLGAQGFPSPGGTGAAEQAASGSLDFLNRSLELLKDKLSGLSKRIDELA